MPWHNAMISGFIVDPDRKKMSKSKGNVVTPLQYLDSYTADGVRYWAASARLGTDTIFDEGVMKNGRRLVIKIFNAGKFVLAYGGEKRPITEALDLAFLLKLRDLVAQATKLYERYEPALQETEDFFWHNFTDTYIELAKARARAAGEPGASEEAKQAGGSAVAALRLGLSVLLRLFAPVLPYITEEVWSWAFAAEDGPESIHAAPWPGGGGFCGRRAAGECGGVRCRRRCARRDPQGEDARRALDQQGDPQPRARGREGVAGRAGPRGRRRHGRGPRRPRGSCSRTRGRRPGRLRSRKWCSRNKAGGGAAGRGRPEPPRQGGREWRR